MFLPEPLVKNTYQHINPALVQLIKSLPRHQPKRQFSYGKHIPSTGASHILTDKQTVSNQATLRNIYKQK
jgi:hypothetical protein